MIFSNVFAENIISFTVFALCAPQASQFPFDTWNSGRFFGKRNFSAPLSLGSDFADGARDVYIGPADPAEENPAHHVRPPACGTLFAVPKSGSVSPTEPPVLRFRLPV